MSFPRYPKYKDSGVEWLGDVPEGWEVISLRHLVAGTNAGEVIDRSYWGGSSELLYTCAINPLDCDFEGFPDAKRTTRNDLLLTRNGTPYVHKPVENAIYTNVVQRITLKKGLDRDYLSTVIQNSADNLKGYGVSIESLNYEMWKALPLPIPPTAEQQAIATFLDRETAKIDALVAEQENLIALLKEKRQAVISHAVTKGLDPTVPMKDSGIEWLGEVPAHWSYGALRRVASRIVVGIAEAATHAYVDVGIPILRSTNIRAGRIIGDILYIDSLFAGERESKLINANDLLTVRTGNAGVTAVVPSSLDGCQCFTMLITTPTQDAISEYLCYWMNSVPAQTYFGLEGWGTAQTNISVPILKDLPVPIPPKMEQESIVAFLDTETAKLDDLTTEAQHTIDLLKERRSALISAAVTGKIDVRCLSDEVLQ